MPKEVHSLVAGPGYFGFTDRWSDEDWELHVAGYSLAQMEVENETPAREHALRELQSETDCWDPNRCDSRRVRRELGDRMVNLSRRANRVPSNARRI